MECTRRFRTARHSGPDPLFLFHLFSHKHHLTQTKTRSQELNRVLFDALEGSFRGTPAQTLFQDLYQGKMMDQIVCQECKSVTGREDSFLDLPLVIRNASSLEEALDKFVEKVRHPPFLSHSRAQKDTYCKEKRLTNGS